MKNTYFVFGHHWFYDLGVAEYEKGELYVENNEKTIVLNLLIIVTRGKSPVPPPSYHHKASLHFEPKLCEM